MLHDDLSVLVELEQRDPRQLQDIPLLIERGVFLRQQGEGHFQRAEVAGAVLRDGFVVHEGVLFESLPDERHRRFLVHVQLMGSLDGLLVRLTTQISLDGGTHRSPNIPIRGLRSRR